LRGKASRPIRSIRYTRNKQSKSELDIWTPELDKLKTEMRTATAKYEKFLKANNIKDRKRTSKECSPQEINFRSAKRMSLVERDIL
jgi:hypothetical protein